jgi:hypothetical protein
MYGVQNILFFLNDALVDLYLYTPRDFSVNKYESSTAATSFTMTRDIFNDVSVYEVD